MNASTMRRARGYTLIEVIVAFAVLALALTLLLGTLSGASRQLRWADDAGRASLHAQSLIDQLGVGEALVPGQRQGEFENGRLSTLERRIATRAFTIRESDRMQA